MTHVGAPTRLTDVPARLSSAFDLQRSDRSADAVRLYREILAVDPDNPDALHLLGMLAHQSGGREAEAQRLMLRSIELAPKVPDFHNNYAGLLQKSGRFAAAIEHLRTAIALRQEYPEAYNNLGAALDGLGRVGEAIEAYQRADALRSGADGTDGYPEALANLAIAQESAGLAAAALESRSRALRLKPGAEAHSDFLIGLHYVHGDDGPLMHEEHLKWAQRYARPLYPHIRSHGNDRDPNRKLRIGYLSADFRSHPVARFFEPVLEGHGRTNVEAICYANVEKPDPVTDRIRRLSDGWRDIFTMPDEAVAELIRKDGIDILVNLTGHMSAGRIAVMAMKPAPVQANYIGYPNTFGMATVDWRITDAWQEPLELGTDQFHAERLMRIEGGCWCYRASERSPDVNDLPLARNGGVTFAALNRFEKVTEEMLDLWSRILKQLPDSKLVLRAPDDPFVRQRLNGHGIDPGQVTIGTRKAHEKYLARYADTDIALDTFPYNGHTTTCDAAWMGVPTVTRAGRTSVSRTGVGLLNSLGLEDLIAEDDDQYVAIAVKLASDRFRLAELRKTLRGRMAASPLMDKVRLTRGLERAFRTMWSAWCGCEG